MPKSAIVALAAAAFLLPIGVVAFQHRDSLLKAQQPDFRNGELLFFTSPG